MLLCMCELFSALIRMLPFCGFVSNTSMHTLFKYTITMWGGCRCPGAWRIGHKKTSGCGEPMQMPLWRTPLRWWPALC